MISFALLGMLWRELETEEIGKERGKVADDGSILDCIFSFRGL
jgi:hypothetical protein